MTQTRQQRDPGISPFDSCDKQAIDNSAWAALPSSPALSLSPCQSPEVAMKIGDAIAAAPRPEGSVCQFRQIASRRWGHTHPFSIFHDCKPVLFQQARCSRLSKLVESMSLLFAARGACSLVSLCQLHRQTGSIALSPTCTAGPQARVGQASVQRGC